MSDLDGCETTQVVICGCGPTGAMLSAYLGQMSIDNVVLEKEQEITTDPRGIALDEDGIRFLQGIGLYDSIYTEIGTCMRKFKFIGGTEQTLNRKPFIELDQGKTTATGHVGFLCHKQPILEKNLRKAMSLSKSCQLRSGCTVVDLLDDGEWTYCLYHDAQGKAKRIRSRFFIGTDGKTRYTRKQYLEPRGIIMEQAHQAFYDETWVASNWEISLPNNKTHPEFPLWSLGYTPEQVYDLFFPVSFRFLCNAGRPAVCGRFGLSSDRLWRFEFVVLEDEDGEEMSKPEMIRKIVFPYITHPGSRYGMSSSLKIVSRCYDHVPLGLQPGAAIDGPMVESLYVHVFPPFGGQGIASGFRDAVSLAWRLALLCRPQFATGNAHEQVLTAWYHERKQQLERSLSLTIQNGSFVTESNPFKIFLRDWYLFAMQYLPFLRSGSGIEKTLRYQHSTGMPFMPEYNGGLSLPQVYCKAIGGLDGDIRFTDDVIFQHHKTGLFQLFVYLKRLDELHSARDMISHIEELSEGEFRISEVTFIIEDIPCEPCETEEDLSSAYRLATGEEFLTSYLCYRRPKPRSYNPYCLGKRVEERRFVIIRPDRIVFAACDYMEDLEREISTAVVYLQEG